MEFRDGVININKPQGLTSQDVCTRLKRRLHIKKIGHTGTLDPMATGVLPVCIGKATRIIEYYDNDFKSYHAAMKLGIITDTLDITGTVTEEHDASGVTEEAVRSAFAGYVGTVTQIPPKYSALKIGGKRAYDLAREGVEFEIKGREITIVSNEISAMDLTEGTVEFDVTCSKGTYIRTICDDIGRDLGCGAVMTALVRTGSGCFGINKALDLDMIDEMTDEEIASRIIPMDQTLKELGRIELNDNRIIAFINGNTSDKFYRIAEPTRFYSGKTGTESGKPGYPVYRVYGKGEFLGTGHIEKGTLVPDKVIRTQI